MILDIAFTTKTGRVYRSIWRGIPNFAVFCYRARYQDGFLAGGNFYVPWDCVAGLDLLSATAETPEENAELQRQAGCAPAPVPMPWAKGGEA